MDGNEMNHCPRCGQDSPTNTNFCVKCGVAFAASNPNSNSGRPVISMDPRKQGQLSENAKQYSSQNLNPQTPQAPRFQIPPPSQQVSRKGNQQSKIVMGVVGALIAVGALFVVLGNRDSSAPSVAPSDQQSESDYVPEPTGGSRNYSSYDDYSYEFRSAFIDSCDSGGLYESCVCVLENLEATYTVEDVLYLYESGDTTYMNAAIQDCM
jgi:hypothetical protein